MMKMPNLHIKNKLALILILSLIIRLIVAWQPVPILVERILLDDSLYGFSIAKNIALGNGITYNGIDVTNGLQPLWVFLISPVYLFFSNINTAVNVILSIEAILDTLIVFLIYKFATRLFDERIGLLASFIWAINPLVFFQTLSGIDVTLYIVMVLATLVYFNKIKDSLTIKNMAILGLLMGLTFLARGDGIFLFLVLTSYILFTRRMTLISNKFLTLLLISAVVVSPWLLWNYFTFGTLQQSSERANYYAAHGIVPFFDLTPATTFSEITSRIGENFLRAFGALANQMGVIDFSLSVGTMVLLPFFLLKAFALLKNWSKMTIPLAFSILLILFYAGYMWGVQIRYMTPIVPFLTILLAAGLFHFMQKPLGSYSEMKITSVINLVFILMIYILAVVLIFNGYAQWEKGYFIWQRYIYQDALWISQNTSESDVIGSFAAGIPIYFSDRTVINLDGILNYNATAAILDKSMYSYMQSRNISYWIESSYGNQTMIDLRKEGNFSIMKDNQWASVFESDSDMDLIRNRCGVFKHMRGFDMLVCFYIIKMDYNHERDYESLLNKTVA